MHPVYIYPLVPAIALGILNWLYWKKQGYTSKIQLIVGIAVFYYIFYKIFLYFMSS